MTTTTSTKPAAKTAKAAAPKPPALDFANLTVESVTEMPKRSGGEKVRKTPVFGWLEESQKNGTAKRVVVPEANVKQIENLIRQASNALHCGAKIVREDAGNGNVAVVFKAVPRRAYKPRARKTASAK